MKRQITFNLFNARDQVQRKISTFVLSLMMLLPVLLTACLGVLPNESVESDMATPASEEVQIAAESEAVTDSTFKAANPELMVFERYTTVVNDEAKAGSAFYATNPELMMASRYAATVKADSASPDADPLKRMVRCCFGIEKWTDTSASQAANPELMAAARYENMRENKTVTDSAFYAANPELLVVHRYAAALEAHRRHFPGR